jgi:hypothetical protein
MIEKQQTPGRNLRNYMLWIVVAAANTGQCDLE